MKKIITVLGLLSLGSAEAALIDRGGGLIYDDVQNITWLQDANYAQTSGYDDDGQMSWSAAMSWADGLNYYDSVRGVTYSDWRLPATPQPDATCTDQYDGLGYGSGCTGSEMGHLANIDGVAWNFDGATWTTPPIFINLIDNFYWSGTEHAPDNSTAYLYDFWENAQYRSAKWGANYAFAVRDGDVAASVVPIPAAVWLFASGLGLLGWMKRRTA